MAGYGSQSRDTGGRGKKSPGRPPADMNKVTFTIYAMTDEIIQKAITKLENILDKAMFKKEFTDSTIKKLDSNQVQIFCMGLKLPRAKFRMSFC